MVVEPIGNGRAGGRSSRPERGRHLGCEGFVWAVNILDGAFARQIDTFKEREDAGKLARGRQVLLKLDDKFCSTDAQHGLVYEFDGLLSFQMVNVKLETFRHNWETVGRGSRSLSLYSIARSSASKTFCTI